MAAKRPNPLTDRIARAIQAQDAWRAAQGAADAIGMIPDAVGRVAQGVQDYAYSRTPEQFGQDVYGLAYRAADDNMRGFTQNPVRHMANQAYSMSPLAAIPPAIRAYNQVVKAQQTGTRPAWRDAMGEVGLAAFGALPGAGGKGKAAAKVLKEGEALLRDAEGVAQIGHNMAPTTKKALATESRYLPPGQKPIVTQAGERREPLGGHEQFYAQHPSAFTPFYNIKPVVDPSEVAATYEDYVQKAPVRMLTPADLEGAFVASLTGDSSISGKNMTGLNGLEFKAPVSLDGGPDHAWMQDALGHPAGWASMKTQINRLKGPIRSALDQGKDIYGLTTNMGPKSLDQTTMMTDAIARMVQGGDVSKSAIQAFDQKMNDLGMKLPSIGNTDELIHVLGQSSQNARKRFVDEVDTSPQLAAGLPEVGAVRMSLTNPDLLQMPGGASGYRIVKFGPESLRQMEEGTYRPHPSYDTPIWATPYGGYDELVPFDLQFPDWVQDRRIAGKLPGDDLRSLDLKKPVQFMSPQVVDKLMLFRSGAQKRRR